MDEQPKQNKGGQPPHEPTLLSRAKVEGFTLAGFSQERIANYFDLDIKTLRKHYRFELECSQLDKIDALAKNLYKDALDGDKASREFYLKTRGGWAYAKPKEDEKKDDAANTLLEMLKNGTLAVNVPKAKKVKK